MFAMNTQSILLNDFSVSEKRLAKRKRFVHMDIGASDSEAANVLSEWKNSLGKRFPPAEPCAKINSKLLTCATEPISLLCLD